MANMDTAILSPIVLFWLAWNLSSTLSENYFLDIMGINGMKNAGNYMFIADGLSKVIAGVLQPTPGHRWRDQHFKMAIIPASIDAIAKAFIMVGISMAGAQARAILGTSTIVWSALLSYFSVGRVVSGLQWSGIATLIVGALVKTDYSKAFSGGDGGDKVALGMVFILIGMMLHSLTGVVVEYFTRECSIPAAKLECVMGSINLVLWCTLFAFGFIVPEPMDGGKEWIYRRENLNWMRFDDGKYFGFGMGMSSGLAWLGFLVASSIHYSAFYKLLGTVGVVTIAAQKSLVTAGYTAFSAIMFCDKSVGSLEKYCAKIEWLWQPPFVRGNVASAALCLAGVILYSYATHLKDVRAACVVRTSDSVSDEAHTAIAGKGASFNANMNSELQYGAMDDLRSRV